MGTKEVQRVKSWVSFPLYDSSVAIEKYPSKSAGSRWLFHHGVPIYLCLFSILNDLNQNYTQTYCSNNSSVS